jgi:prepilin-type N-terminal cleavage/methylation domain-containing protein/prepilin-type processing-associated H-X9-DG protein
MFESGMRNQRTMLSPAERARGFTLLELLVVIGIIAVLVSVVGGSLAKVRRLGQSVMCMNNLKTIGQEFFVFADDRNHGYRGSDDRAYRKLFRLEDFQEKLYRIHEFWDGGTSNETTLNPSNQPLICPSARVTLKKRRNLPCSSSAISPLENVSVGFNMRLDQVSTLVNGWARLQRTRLSTRILEHPDTPLAFGVDGAEAVRKGVLPHYAAPPAGDTGLYGTGRFWFPSLRHDGKLNVAYVGGYVQRTADPGRLPRADWGYQPELQ